MPHGVDLRRVVRLSPVFAVARPYTLVKSKPTTDGQDSRLCRNQRLVRGPETLVGAPHVVGLEPEVLLGLRYLFVTHLLL